MGVASVKVLSGVSAPNVEVNLDSVLSELFEEFAKTADHYDRTGEFPFRNFERLHQHGLLALAVPVQHGGQGASLATLVKVVGTLAKGDPSTALVLTMQYLFTDFAARNVGWPEHLRAKVLSDAVNAGALINGLRVEPELGTPARGGLPGTIAYQHADGWRLRGRKIYSTGLPGLTWMTVWARTDESVPRVGGWLVHRDTPGLKIVESWDHLGMRATGSHEAVFDDVIVPLDHALGILPHDQVTPRLDPIFTHRNSILISTVYDAVARSARDWLVNWLRHRVPSNLGKPLSQLPHFHQVVGEIDTLLYANRTLLDAAISDDPSSGVGAQLKYVISKQAIAVVEKAIEVTGNPGLTRTNPLQRHLRDVLCSRVHTPQNDSILAGVGKAALEAADQFERNGVSHAG